MTIIVGVICNDGIVLASDSQAGSFKGVHVKRLDYTKIYDFSFDRATTLVTGAGETPFITRAIEIFESKAKESKFHKCREVADLAETVMNEVNKRYIVERGKELGFIKSPTAARPRWQDDRTLGFALVVGLCCNNESRIYTVYPDGVAERAERYASLGSGSAFAEYLLARLYRDDLTLDEAIRVAVYVIEEVKKVDLHCGGPTQVVAVKGNQVIRKNEKELQEILSELNQADKSVMAIWRVISSPEQMQKFVEEKKKAAPKK